MKRTFIVMVGAILLSACGESAFKDAFDSGKYSPDETKVRTNQALTTPPDLQLRPPSGAVNPQQPAPVYQQPVTTAPPQYGAVQPQPRQAYVPPAGQQPVGQAPLGQAPGANGQRPPVASQPDAFTRNGISHFKADGSKKTRQELLDELRAKKLAETKRKNPNHGTIFNLPQWFKDNQS